MIAHQAAASQRKPAGCRRVFIRSNGYLFFANRSVIDKAIAEQAAGAGLILWTCREGELLQQALDACAQWGLHFDAVNESLPSWIAAFGTRPRKVGASEYWDDRAVVVRDGEVQL